MCSLTTATCIASGRNSGRHYELGKPSVYQFGNCLKTNRALIVVDSPREVHAEARRRGVNLPSAEPFENEPPCPKRGQSARFPVARLYRTARRRCRHADHVGAELDRAARARVPCPRLRGHVSYARPRGRSPGVNIGSDSRSMGIGSSLPVSQARQLDHGQSSARRTRRRRTALP